MKQFIMLICSLALLAGCKKSASVDNDAGPTALLSGTAPDPFPVEPVQPSPCFNGWEPWNNNAPGPLIQVPPHPGVECAKMLSTFCAGGDVDNWRFNDPNYFDGANIIMVKTLKSIPAAVYRVTITSTYDNSIRADGIVNMGTGTYTSLASGEYVESGLCLWNDPGCAGYYDCIVGSYYHSGVHGLDGVSVKITNMSSQTGFCYEVYTQYIGP